ncbi:MAG TPA: zinc ABC transporter substrate-binding protein [Candidatus Pacearchaeota archaeon]|nr:zinc ABC transporter substrate-binding protein [Candidatus Pacearchaeota archaeon]HPZ74327.1 zinc ABC transporter substrate-binding protein [Candidatus Pacearchaeota archaeon]HQD88932.1 zinc ABC transporter substrate-binding protein [Candidatus Pacearchaeota archaeon]
MNKKFEKLLDELRKLDLPDGKYAILGSGPLAVRGIREARDLDIIVTDDLYKKLQKEYSQNDKIKLGKIEIFSANGWRSKFGDLTKMIKKAEKIQGLRFVCLEDLIEWKTKLGRPKDLEDIKLIKDYLKSFNNVFGDNQG